MQASIIWQISVFIVPLFLSIILHEMAHGWVAYKCGDKTAKLAGRLTLNPLSHIDPVGSVIVPTLLLLSKSGFMFGWAKPVPVNFSALHDEKKDMGLVALAGPFLNFILALFASILLVVFMPDEFKGLSMLQIWLLGSLRAFQVINLSLCAFNLFPVLPLDGGRILVSILPKEASQLYAQTERYGFIVLLSLLFFFPMLGIDILSDYMLWIRQGLMEIIDFILKGVS